MSAKSLAPLSATALLAVASATTAHAQGWRNDGGSGWDGYRPRCPSSYGINESLARRGSYPLANVGAIHMWKITSICGLLGGMVEQFVATVDGCTGQVMR